MLPVKGVAMRQVVVRLRSVQSLTRTVPARKGQPDTRLPERGEEKALTEYLVMQKRIVQGKEEPWIVWGTTRESEV